MIEQWSYTNPFWSCVGPFGHLIISTRIRLSRNIHGLRFAHNMEDEDLSRENLLIEKYCGNSANALHLSHLDLCYMDRMEKQRLRESGIISREMEQSDQSMLIMNKVDDSCLHINDHDHIRIITIAPGLQLESAYAAADAIDNDLNQFIPYAFSDDLGYLSPMISNIGTGMKVSIAAHLPALSMNNHISDMIQPLRNNGFELLGNVSDSIKSKGDIYVISNKTKLGISESECIIRLGSMIRDIIEAEDDEREALYSDSKNEIEDMVFRSYGILTNARSISHKEAMQLLSLLRMGVLLAFFKNIDIAAINNLMVQIQPAHIQSFYGMSFNDKRECDEIRADFIRSEIGNFEVM